MDRGAYLAMVHRVAESDTTEATEHGTDTRKMRKRRRANQGLNTDVLMDVRLRSERRARQMWGASPQWHPALTTVGEQINNTLHRRRR